MNFRFVLLSLIITLSAVVFAEQTPEENAPYDFQALTKNQPSDVVKFIKRIDECSHWSGEEGYDEARRKEINAAIKKLKCEQIQADGNLLKKKYKNKKSAAAAIDKAINAIP